MGALIITIFQMRKQVCSRFELVGSELAFTLEIWPLEACINHHASLMVWARGLQFQATFLVEASTGVAQQRKT